MNDTRVSDLYIRLYWHNRQKEEEMTERFRLVRLQTWSLINLQLPHNSRMASPEDLWTLESEREEVTMPGTAQQQVDALVKLMENI